VKGRTQNLLRVKLGRKPTTPDITHKIPVQASLALAIGRTKLNGKIK
jgi:hypothetical protein